MEEYMGFHEPSPMDTFRVLVERRFQVEDELVEFNIPTFYVMEDGNLKNKFLDLLMELDGMGYSATLRRVNGRIRIQIFLKPKSKPSDRRINMALLLATIGTTFFAGYLQSTEYTNPYYNAGLFTIAMLGVLGLHEMGHKLAARKYRLEASDPYFIPGPPPLGTFGAVIRQKSLIPNRDALFDLGAMGPIVGFIVSILVTAIGLRLSQLVWVPQVPPGTLNTPILYRYIADLVLEAPPNPNNLPHLLILLHPVAFAGYVGMLVTMLNLIPVGQLDGGHIAYCFLGNRGRNLLGMIAIAGLFISGYWFFALFALFWMFQPHPEPLDNVTGVSRSRKITALLIVAIFVLSLAPQSFL